MATLKIKKGDTVRVIAGKDKDKEGKVLAVDAKKGRVIVEGVNMVKKHLKAGRESQEGGIITREGSIDISNVMYVHKGQTTRIGFHIDENGKFDRQHQQEGQDHNDPQQSQLIGKIHNNSPLYSQKCPDRPRKFSFMPGVSAAVFRLFSRYPALIVSCSRSLL